MPQFFLIHAVDHPPQGATPSFVPPDGSEQAGPPVSQMSHAGIGGHGSKPSIAGYPRQATVEKLAAALVGSSSHDSMPPPPRQQSRRAPGNTTGAGHAKTGASTDTEEWLDEEHDPTEFGRLPATYQRTLRLAYRTRIRKPYDVVEDYVHAARRALFPIINDRGSKIWVTRYDVDYSDFEAIVLKAVTNSREIIILTGTHGAPSGYRSIKHKDSTFWETDWDRFGRMPFVTIRDLTRMSVKEVRDVIQGDTEVIAAFCHSANDFQLRSALGLKPGGVSYLPPE
ncbi:hypothetical protein WKR88_00470 [Trinickia caryophylli]|uniref:Toxin with a H, D/N and C signature n=1 Tax=Trinickia caryophylli TaxID=28094 RepID=A0A1X7D1K3_TRICW|nr:hypothetical protein [Trinickia caryophylli]PMS13586.1 hypothetical protein C0Z17_04720 [Trinickia caryophylli]TRX15246.1 hypothetical protein FNF07_29140 [Trinickia caryophylli]WQE15119.1 hypothetical protein U0034_21460 [Trinickia caryophylli]SMF07026.1 Toxin with a H, D/N and C signature [Trinickia caryophylli]GLU31143.1 hypothetical protein Busp01_09850 [Trinickia caryophylli]